MVRPFASDRMSASNSAILRVLQEQEFERRALAMVGILLPGDDEVHCFGRKSSDFIEEDRASFGQPIFCTMAPVNADKQAFPH
jgi:hypothetical protein